MEWMNDGSWKEYEEVSFGDFGNKKMQTFFPLLLLCQRPMHTSISNFFTMCAHSFFSHSLVRSIESKHLGRPTIYTYQHGIQHTFCKHTRICYNIPHYNVAISPRITTHSTHCVHFLFFSFRFISFRSLRFGELKQSVMATWTRNEFALCAFGERISTNVFVRNFPHLIFNSLHVYNRNS